MFVVAETDRLPADAYAPEVTARVYGSLAEKAKRAITAGHSAIVDAVFAKPQERAIITDLAAREKLAFTGLFLTADTATRIARVGKRVNDASDANMEIARKQEEYDLGTLDWNEVDANGTPGETLEHAREKLRN